MKTKLLFTFCMILISMAFVSAVSITDVSSTPTEVIPGETVNIAIEIENIFEYDVTNLNVQLVLSGENIPFAPYQSSSEKFLDKLGDGDEEDFKFKLIALPETRTGIYKIPVKITYNYEDENSALQEGNKSELISVTVNSEPELKTSLDDSVVLIKGRENTLTLKIINSGLSDVKFLYVIISDVGGLKFLNEKEQYIGDIDSDDFDNAEYSVIVNADAPGTITLPVILTYLDSTNKEFSETQNLTLKTYSFKEAVKLGLVKKPNFVPYIVVGILVVGFLIRRYLKKRKLKKSRR